MVFIYALQLEQQKYYIGKTNNPQFRLDKHFNSNGAEWTKKYKPVHIVEIIPNYDEIQSKDSRKYFETIDLSDPDAYIKIKNHLLKAKNITKKDGTNLNVSDINYPKDE
jgi:hypothetical protein